MSRSAQFRTLYSRYFRSVWSVVGQLGLYGAAREDAVQEVWLIAYRRIHTLDPQASARAWLASIARRVVWRTRRSAQRLDRRVHALAEQPRSLPADASTRYEAATTVADALESLSEEQRSVLVLSTLHGFTAPEIAAALDVPVNTVYSRLRLARRRLAEFSVQSREVEAELESRERPPDKLRQRVLRAVLPGVPMPMPLLGAASSLKAFALGGVVGGLAVAGTAQVAARPAAQLPAQVSTQPAAPGGSHSAAAVHASPAPAPAVLQSSSVAPASPDDPLPRAAPPPPPRRSAKPTSVPDEAKDAALRATAQEPAKPGLAVGPESVLLARAQKALRQAQPRQALRLLRQHELQFPQGALVDVREGAMVRALCAAGRSADAAHRVRRLRARQPGSPVATGVQDVCGED